MPVDTQPSQDLLEQTRRSVHPRCMLCGGSAPGKGLYFQLQPDASVEAVFTPADQHQGYPDMLHGGMISALLDGAMTNCLFAHGLRAVTAEMAVRFRHPVSLEAPMVARGWLSRKDPPLFILGAEIRQNGQVRATAEAKFMQNG